MSVLKEAIMDFTFSGKEIQGLNEILIDDAVVTPEVTELHSVDQNIKAKQKIGYLSRLSKVTKIDQGCGENFTDYNAAGREKEWNPVSLETPVKQCYTDLENTFFVWTSANGLDRTKIETAVQFIITLLQDAVREDAQRIAWFGDTAIDDIGSGGTLALAAEIPNYNQYNGFWKQIFAGVTATTMKRVTITANGGANYAGQALAADAAMNLFQSMVEDADTRLFANGNMPIIRCTRSLLNNYKRTLRSKSTDASFMQIENGKAQYYFDGVPIREYELWDRYIKADFDNGTKWDLPHRAVLTTNQNLRLGVDSADASSNFEAEYQVKTKEVYIRNLHKADAKVIRDYLVMAAY